MSPQTSISVHHTIVRNQPAYPFPYTETTQQTDGTEDTSYYYTYEDISEEASRKITSTITPMTTLSTAKPTAKSFWNSQKAMLDARRKESSQKFVPTYNRQPSVPKEKPSIEFKVREKPKFGLANKNKYSSPTTTKKPEVTTTKPTESTTPSKVVKTNIQANLPIQKLPEKDLIKNLKNSNFIPNQIVGRIGEIPVQSSLASQIQSPIRAQSTIINSFGGSRPSKFDESVGNMQFVDNARKIQSTIQSIQNQQNLRASLNQPALLSNIKPQPLLTLNNQPLNLNQQPTLNQQQNLPLNVNQQALQQALNNLNQQQTALNLNQQQPALNLNQQQPLSNINTPPGNAFIAATAPLGTSGRSAAGQSAGSSLLQRLGQLGLNLNGNGDNNNNAALNNVIMGRDGGYGGGGGGGNGFTVNLGPVPDPLTFFLRLLSLIPRPLLDLNGRIFFGIELGKNAGLVSGSGGAGGAKPYNG